MKGLPLEEPWGTRNGKGGGRPPTPPIERVLGRLDTSIDGCWEWPGTRTPLGYGIVGSGTVGRNARRVYVHRVVYEHFHGAIPSGHVVMHRCDNPPCCNPAHLASGTQADNIADASAKGRIRNQHS